MLRKEECRRKQQVWSEKSGFIQFVLTGKSKSGRNMITFYKYIREINTTEKEQLFKQKDDSGTTTERYKLVPE